MNEILILALFLPLVSFLFFLMIGQTLSRLLVGIMATSSVLISFISFSYLFISNSWDSPITLVLFNWVTLPPLQTDFSLHLDTLSLLMTLIITGVGFLIHAYSIGYMDREKDYVRYFAALNLFTFAMLLLVLASNLLLLFVGWEGVGIASYLLIGFWYEKPLAAQAATKAFIVNRIGDFGLLMGIVLTYYLIHTSDISLINTTFANLYQKDASILILLSLLYFIGAIGKSAQLPLQIWLPDAMEGPTPVSALIHAATMVTAGVYLIVRLSPLFLLAPTTLYIVGAIGVMTSLFAAISAAAQTDLKRVLAYSTISQLGFMFLACGVGAFYAAMFHLTMHAFMKALLFLSAGNVVHSLHNITDMRKMGGLSKIFNKTHILFLIGVLAMSGIPPLAAFFSKDLILEESSKGHYYTFYLIALLSSFLTAFYLTRAYYLTFKGPTRDKSILVGVKEAPSIMLIPVAILATLSIVGGFLGFSIEDNSPLELFLSKTDASFKASLLDKGFHLSIEVYVSCVVAILGIFSALFIFSRQETCRNEKLDFLINLMKNAFYVDEIYAALFVNPLRKIAQFIGGFIEPLIFDGSLIKLSLMADRSAKMMQKMQSGQIRSYIAWLTLGSVFLILSLTV